MRHFDLTPLYRSTIGFDRLGSLLDTLGAFEGDTPSYPPYNIERVGENEYRISMAVAGFGEKDLSIEVKENTLSIRGEKQAEVEQTTYLHRGIAGRSFERRFQLADHVVIKGASLENGLLHVDGRQYHGRVLVRCDELRIESRCRVQQRREQLHV